MFFLLLLASRRPSHERRAGYDFLATDGSIDSQQVSQSEQSDPVLAVSWNKKGLAANQHRRPAFVIGHHRVQQGSVMSQPRAKNARQTKLGPAPFASFDHSEDLSSPESKGYAPMPEIFEDGHPHFYRDAYASNSSVQTPTTPRIDVEQASSPSQDDSYDSTPERDIFGIDADGNITSDFLEGIDDMDLDRRASANDYNDPHSAANARRRLSPAFLRGTGAVNYRKVSLDAGDSVDGLLVRKGSGGFVRSNPRESSALPGPRDSRLSSISSNVSATSGLSALSAFSRRSPSPHRMLLETSFCGPKLNAHQLLKESRDSESSPRRSSLVTISPLSVFLSIKKKIILLLFGDLLCIIYYFWLKFFF